MIFGKRYYWLFQIFGWGCFFLWQLFNAWSFDKLSVPEDRLLIMQRAAGFCIIGLFMTHGLRITLLNVNVFSKRVLNQILIFLAFTLLTSFLAGGLEMIIYKKLQLLSKGEMSLAKRSIILTFLNNAFSWFSIFIPWSAIYFIYHYVNAAQKEQIDTLKLKSHIKELELKTIKTHINPHFIFNSLNGIRAMVDENPQRARTAITELSNILRSSINIDKTETISLSDELNIVKDYLALEQMRFEDRLKVMYCIDDKTTKYHLPPMMLQIMVENAIKHGISHEVNGGLVKISAINQQNALQLVVENTGRIKEHENEGGFGLKSIRERLNLMYGNRAGFEIKQSTHNTVTAILELPVL